MSLGEQHRGASGSARGQQGGGGISPTHGNEPRSIPRAAAVRGARVFSHKQNGCRQRLLLLPIAAASKKSPLAAALPT